MKNKIVYLCNPESVYNKKLIKEVENKGYEVQILHFAASNRKNKIMKFFFTFFNYIKEIHKFPISKRNLTILHIQYVRFYYVFLLLPLKLHFSKIILTFWGSDLLGTEKKRIRFMLPLYFIANKITFETEQMSSIFFKILPFFKNKIYYTRFGLSELEEIDKITNTDISNFSKKYRILSNRINLVIGYNRNKNQQHLKVIQSITSLQANIQIIIPWTYGPIDDTYQKDIDAELRKRNLSYVFLFNFLNDNEVACLRKITNVLIQVQTTDSLSASMLETLYAEKEVITGSWLPYNWLHQIGLKMNLVNRVDEVGQVLKNIVENESDENVCIRKKNKEIIANECTWENCIIQWINLYD